LKQAKILNENTKKYLNLPIVESLGWVVVLGKEFIMKRLLLKEIRDSEIIRRINKMKNLSLAVIIISKTAEV